MNKILVAYFSVTGITKKIAKTLSNEFKADLFEIIPEEPYTDDDLDWQSKTSRSSIEMANLSSRPEILNHVDNMSDYDTIFIGFPIWWGREPSIIDTFICSYSFNNKIIIPFATSQNSGIGKSGKRIQTLAKNAIVDDGKCLNTAMTEKEIYDWGLDRIKKHENI